MIPVNCIILEPRSIPKFREPHDKRRFQSSPRPVPMSYRAYLFEAGSLQDYILDGRNLAEHIAVSELVASLCDAPLAAVLDTLGLTDTAETRFFRRTTGAFHLVLSGPDADTQARRLRDLWSLACDVHCPGLEYVHALAEGTTPTEALGRGQQALARQYPAAALPETPPLARRDPHSGRAAVWQTGQEWRDRLALRISQRESAPILSLPSGHPPWPRSLATDAASHMPSFPWLVGNRYLALVHCAVHGLDTVMASCGDPVPCPSAVHTAAQEALSSLATSSPILPGLPLLVRDDQFTALVRADLALPFAATFCLAFERAATPAASLTTHVGIAYAKAGWPLIQAQRLAAKLSAQARHESQRTCPGDEPLPASLAFARATDGARNGNAYLGFPAYGLTRGPLPGWQPLVALTKLLAENEVAVGPARQLLALLRQAPGDAQRPYRRWREILAKALPRHLERFDALLAELGLVAKDVPVIRQGQRLFSPLEDAFVLRAVSHGNPSTLELGHD